MATQMMTPAEMIEHGVVRKCGECGKRRVVKDWYIDALEQIVLLCRNCLSPADAIKPVKDVTDKRITGRRK